VSTESDGLAVWPPSTLPYVLDSQPPPPSHTAPTSPEFARAEHAEQVERDPRTAGSLYRTLLQSAADAERPVLLHRLARTARATGRNEEARGYLRELQAYRQPVAGPVPADFIATFDLCAFAATPVDAPRLASCARDLYRDLVNRRWSLERPRYLYYASSVRAWLAAAGALDAGMSALIELEAKKTALAEAIETLAPEGDASLPAKRAIGGTAFTRLPGYLAATWDQSDATSASPVALVISDVWFDRQIRARILSSAEDTGADVTIAAEDGTVLLQSGGADRSADAQRVTVDYDSGGLRLRLTAWPRDQTALAAQRSRRQTFYLSLLGLVALVMASGAYLTVRAVRHELAVAQLKADFVAAVSHEFRSPLTGIRQLGELLMRGRVSSDERRHEYYARITQESDRLSRLVEHLLDFARMESGRREYRRAPMDPGPWLRDLTAAFRAQQPDGALDLHVAVASDLPVINADPEALACAVQNLLDNAVKYSPGRAVVRVSADRDADGLIIRVRDEGEGISDEDRVRVFDTFYRGSNTRDRRVAGAGIGLGLVHHIVSAHGGRVTCESRLGHGTTFTTHLPAMATAASSAWGAGASAPADSGQG
jgi:signal transduction histidine kinase